MKKTYSREEVRRAIARIKARKAREAAADEMDDMDDMDDMDEEVMARRAAVRRAVARVKARKAEELAMHREAARRAISEIKARKASKMQREAATANTKVEKIASKVAAIIEARMERILADTEEIVKENVPARYVSAALTKLEKSLSREGISCAFDKKISRQTLRKTAGIECSSKDVDEACSEFTKAVVAETEDTLEQADAKIAQVAGKHFRMRRLATRRIRRAVEAKLAKVMRFSLEGVDEEA